VSFEVKDKDLGGRIGKLTTKSGVIETPAFFPVVNPLRQWKEVSVDQLKSLGFNQLITNAYIIKKSLNNKVIDVHNFLEFNGVVMTDSGAYQLLRYGVKKVEIDPIEIVKFQEMISADIGVIADIPTRDDASYSDALYSVEETLRRAEIVLDIIRDSAILWVLPIQGGIYLDLVEFCARRGRELPYYSIYAIGSPVTVMEKYEFAKLINMIITAKKNLPLDKPVHLFGAGHPLIIPFVVALGIDMFDSASYILYARDERYMTESGTYHLKDLDYLPCECPICSKYDVKTLMDMDRGERTRCIAIHNLYVIQREVKRVKVAIREGRLWELLEERARTHPSLRQAFNIITRRGNIMWLERLDPRIKGDAHALFLYDETSNYRPEIIRHKVMIKNYVKGVWGRGRQAVLLPGAIKEKPFRTSKLYDYVVRSLRTKELDVYIYLPYFTLIPLVLDHTYPYSHFEVPEDPDRGTLIRYASELRNLIKTLKNTYKSVLIASCDRWVWSSHKFLASNLREVLDEKVGMILVC